MNIGSLTGEITLVDQMTSVLEKLDRVLQVADRSANQTAVGIERLENRMTLAATAGSFMGNVLANAFSRVASFVVGLAKDSVMAGARLEQLTVATRYMGERAGYTGEEIDKLAQDIQKTGISGISARESIQQLLGANIDLANASKLSAIAQNMQSLSGRSSSEVFQVMTRAIATGNTVLLRNIGFQNLSIDALSRAERATTGATGAITGAARTQMVLNAVLKEGASFAGLYDEAMETAGKQLGSSTRAWQEVSEILGTAILPITSVVMKAWYALGTAVRDESSAMGASVKGFMTAMGAGLENAIKAVSSFISDALPKIKSFATDGLDTVMRKIEEFRPAIEAVVDYGRQLKDKWDAQPQMFREIATSIGAAAVAMFFFRDSWVAVQVAMKGSALIAAFQSGGLLAVKATIVGWGAALTGLLIPFAAVTAAVVALGLVIYALVYRWDEVKAATGAFVDFVGPTITKLWETIKWTWDTIKSYTISAWTAVSDAISWAANTGVGQFVIAFSSLLLKIAGWKIIIAGVTAWELLKSTTLTVVDAFMTLGEWVQRLWDKFTTNAVVKQIITDFQNLAETISGALVTAFEFAGRVFHAVFDPILAAVKYLNEHMPNPFASAKPSASSGFVLPNAPLKITQEVMGPVEPTTSQRLKNFFTPRYTADDLMRELAEESARTGVAPPIPLPKGTQARTGQPDTVVDSEGAKAAADYAKKVNDLVISLREGEKGLQVFRDAFKQLTPAQSASYDVQQRLAPEILKYAAANRELTPAMQQVLQQYQNSRTALLEKDIALLTASGTTLKYVNTLKHAGYSEAEIALQLGVTTEALSKYVTMLEFVQTTNDKLLKSNAPTWADFTKKIEETTGRIAKSIIANAIIAKQETDSLSRTMRQRTMSDTDFQIDEIRRLAEYRKSQLTGPGALEAQAAIDLSTADAIDQINLDSLHYQIEQYNILMDDTKSKTDAVNKATTDAAFEGLANFFNSISLIAGDSGIGKFLSAAGQMVAALKLAHDVSEQTGRRFGTLSVVFDKTASNSARLAAGIQSAASIAQGASNIWSATSASRTRGGNALGGAVAGAQAGAFAGVWGMAIGAAAGLVVGLIRGKPAWARAAEEVGRDFGTKIGDELAKTIAAQAKDLFRGSRQAAGIFNLDKIIGEAGGLNANNLTQMTARYRDVFSMLEMGKFSAAQATEVLDANWASFVEAHTDGTGAISNNLKEIIALNDRMGTQSKEIAKWQQGQAVWAIQSFSLIAEGTRSAYEKIGDRVAEAQKALDKIGRDDGSADWIRGQEELTAALTEQFAAAEAAKGELRDLGVVAGASFAAALATGASFSEALATAQPGLMSLRKTYENLGLTIADVEDPLMKILFVQSQVLEQSPGVLQTVDGLSGTLTSLNNLGALNAETFASVGNLAQIAYGRLEAAVVAAGGSTRDALLPMQGYLHAAQKAAEDLEIPIDDFTQSLIDQSKDLGLWKDAGKSAIDTLVDSMTTLTEKMEEFVNILLGIPPVIRTSVEADIRTGGPSSGAPQTPGYPDRNETYNFNVDMDGAAVANVVIDRMGDQFTYRAGAV